MELNELLRYFAESDTIGENQAALDLMRYYSRQAQKITMEINTKYHEPEELQTLFSELIGKPVDEGFGLFPPINTDIVMFNENPESNTATLRVKIRMEITKAIPGFQTKRPVLRVC